MNGRRWSTPRLLAKWRSRPLEPNGASQVERLDNDLVSTPTLDQATSVAPGEILLPPGERIRFDCSKGTDFVAYIYADYHRLDPPVNPSPGVYRLTLKWIRDDVQLSYIDPSLKPRTPPDDPSPFGRCGFIWILEIKIVRVGDRLAFSLEPVFESGRRSAGFGSVSFRPLEFSKIDGQALKIQIKRPPNEWSTSVILTFQVVDAFRVRGRVVLEISGSGEKYIVDVAPGEKKELELPLPSDRTWEAVRLVDHPRDTFAADAKVHIFYDIITEV
jgi:hypothetical protein